MVRFDPSIKPKALILKDYFVLTTGRREVRIYKLANGVKTGF